MDKIVCTDAEEVDFLGELVRQNGRGRNFDHDAELDAVRHFLSFRLKLGLLFKQQIAGSAEFRQRCDHREHDAEISVHARS
ncbi:hypothetical protein D3C73_1381950 [compost metagenome]